MTSKFDKNIPIPEPVVRTKYDFDEMEIGDSKFWLNESASKAAAMYARKSGRKFTTRKVQERETPDGPLMNGVRIWRIE